MILLEYLPRAYLRGNRLLLSITTSPVILVIVGKRGLFTESMSRPGPE
jgi:hypothetical protein